MAKASIVLLAIIFVSQAFGGDYVALVKPEAVGLSSARLERIDNLINKHIEGGVLGVALNEVELMPEDYLGHLHLTPGTYLKIEVSDTGHGILPEIKEKIFEPYFTTKVKGKGTGMGLATVHGIVQSHNGHITVYSEPGKGTTFHVYFPKIQAQESTLDKTTKKVIPSGTEHILLVDDEDLIVQMEKQILNSLGYKVMTTTSSVEALQLIQTEPLKFDLVITDMTMPNMTGAELAQKTLAIRDDIPILLCTGFSELINEEKAKALGIREYLMKPIIKKDLANAMRKVLDGTS